MDSTPPIKFKVSTFASAVTGWIGSPSSIIIHTLIFTIFLVLSWLGAKTEQTLLLLTTIVSLEAIYLSIFIQYSINQSSKTIQEVAEDIEGVTEGVEEISADVETLSDNIEDLHDTNEVSHRQANYEQLEHQIKALLGEVQRLKVENTPPPQL